MFGDGKLCYCKPTSEQDLASVIAGCVLEENDKSRERVNPVRATRDPVYDSS